MKAIIFILTFVSTFVSLADTEPTVILTASKGKRFTYVILEWNTYKTAQGYEIWRKVANAEDNTAKVIFTTKDYRLNTFFDKTAKPFKNYQYAIVPKNNKNIRKQWATGFCGGG